MFFPATGPVQDVAVAGLVVNVAVEAVLMFIPRLAWVKGEMGGTSADESVLGENAHGLFVFRSRVFGG